MTMRAGRQSRNAGSFLRKELGEALRIGPKDFEKTCRPYIPSPNGDTSFLRKEAPALRHAALETQMHIP